MIKSYQERDRIENLLDNFVDCKLTLEKGLRATLSKYEDDAHDNITRLHNMLIAKGYYDKLETSITDVIFEHYNQTIAELVRDQVVKPKLEEDNKDANIIHGLELIIKKLKLNEL